MQTRYLMAALVALTYLVFCVTFLRHRRAQQLQQAEWGTVQATGPQTVLVVLPARPVQPSNWPGRPRKVCAQVAWWCACCRPDS
jgi:hypothetical protein